ncbi:MAG: metallophosphoesterase family protein [Chloroflexi bacterium]|nr:metallophosphoesterase family protein [Chloroflexota bacterium]
MRLAVLSDIHANLAALDAVGDELGSFDELWVLGDIVGYGPQPNEVIRRLQELGARAVTGNHDGAAIGTVDASWFNPDAQAAIQWTTTVLDENARAYLAALPEVRRDGELTAVHGSPREPIWEYITDAAIAAANLGAFETRHCLYGHTHLPVVYQADGAHISVIPATASSPIALDARRALINPGSVGQPRDGNPEASWLMLDTEAGIAEFHRVRYDIALTQRLMREVRLPRWLVERLAIGR